ncbi:MAG TPA: DNA-formamidopyrimidine glycosylase family protein [Streptosporangiaceae bacterium]
MPELPDVEGFRAVLAEHGAGRRVRRVVVADAGVVHGVTARQFDRRLRGRTFAEPRRHGKWLIARTDGPTVLIHFGMTGSLRWASPAEPPGRHDRVTFLIDGGELRYRDMRKLQGITLACDAAQEGRILGRLGPDALEVTRAGLGRLLGSRRAAVKAVLIRQDVIAGLGNLLADEILWRSRILPRRSARSLSEAELDRLHSSMRQVLRESVRTRRVPPRRSWLTGARDEARPECPRCLAPLRRDRVAGRTTVWCPQCQQCR